LTDPIGATPTLAPAASVNHTAEGWVGVNPHGKAYGLGPAIALYAIALASVRTDEELRSRLRADTGQEWTDADLSAARGQLAQLGFLDDETGSAASQKRRVRYVPPLTVQVTLANPERLFSLLQRLLGKVSTRTVFAVAASAVVAGLVAAVINRDVVITSVTHPFGLSEYLVLVAMLTVATALHEAGHAAALARLGGRPRRVGVMLFYLLPAFFCDVSDAWRVGDRRQRALVAASGVLVQVTLAGLAEVVAALLPAGSTWQEVLAAFGVVSFLAALVNAIPFVKFDGYIALMALTGHNFLRRDAIAEGRRLLARAFLTRRVAYAFPDARWLRWYGVGCILFPAYLVASAMWLWVGDLRAFGAVGGVIGLVAVLAFIIAIAREVGRVLRTAMDAGVGIARAAASSVLLVGVVAAAGLLITTPTVTVSGYVRDGEDVRLVLPVGADSASISLPARAVLRSNGLFLHEGAVQASVAAETRFKPEVVPFAAVAPVRTSSVEFRGLTAPLTVEGQGAKVNELDPAGQALVYGAPAPLWLALWRALV